MRTGEWVMYKILTSFVLFFVVLQAAADEFPRATFQRLEGDKPPVIDGKLTDAIWERLPTISEFVQVVPTEGARPSEKTEVQLAYDREYLYLAVRAHNDSGHKVTAKTLIQGQSIFSDDRFAVRLDTFNDRRNAYLFEVNPNGVRREALVGNDYVIDDWDTVWFASAEVTEWGWSAEMKIPVKSISFDPNIDTWGANFSRVVPNTGEQIAWSSRERDLSPAISGFVNGISDLSQGIGLEVSPTLVAQYRDSPGTPSSGDLEPSVTTFYNITPYLTGGLTLNTDFSATEADERQVNLTRFSLFFPEKRDFFLQDAGIFEFANIRSNARPFFSRRLGLAANGTPLDIEAGLKLSGRLGGWNLGTIALRQQAGVESGDETLFIGRATRNIFGESNLGFITTSGDPLSSMGNSLWGTDFSLRNSAFLENRTITADAWYQQSNTEGIAENQRAYGGRIAYPNDRVDGFFEWRRVEENFNPALGFVNRRGVEQFNSSIRYRHRYYEGFVEWFGQRLRAERNDRISGGLDSEALLFNFAEIKTTGNDFLFLFYNLEIDELQEPFTVTNDVTILKGRYESRRYGFFLETGAQRPLAFTLEAVDGEFFGGTNLLTRVIVDWRPNKHLSASMGWRRNKVELPDGRFSTDIYNTRINVAFNSNWAWLNLIQSDNTSNTVGINSRLRFEPRSNQEYYLVLNQLYERETGKSIDTEITLKATYRFRL